MDHKCSDKCLCVTSNPSLCQTIKEMDFERGIWYAAQNNDYDRVEKLLSEKKVDINETDLSGYTALHYASRNGHEKIVKYLIKCGADINAKTRAGEATSLHRAATAGKLNILKVLLQNPQLEILTQDADGKTALHRAVESNNYDICLELIKCNLVLKNIHDNKNKLPIEYAKSEKIKSLFSTNFN